MAMVERWLVTNMIQQTIMMHTILNKEINTKGSIENNTVKGMPTVKADFIIPKTFRCDHDDIK